MVGGTKAAMVAGTTTAMVAGTKAAMVGGTPTMEGRGGMPTMEKSLKTKFDQMYTIRGWRPADHEPNIRQRQLLISNF